MDTTTELLSCLNSRWYVISVRLWVEEKATKSLGIWSQAVVPRVSHILPLIPGAPPPRRKMVVLVPHPHSGSLLGPADRSGSVPIWEPLSHRSPSHQTQRTGLNGWGIRLIKNKYWHWPPEDRRESEGTFPFTSRSSSSKGKAILWQRIFKTLSQQEINEMEKWENNHKRNTWGSCFSLPLISLRPTLRVLTHLLMYLFVSFITFLY